MRNVWGMLHVIFRKQSIQPVLTTMSVTRVLQRKIIFSPDASSTCELICELLDTKKITKEIAECLYTGMVTDTGVFQYSCTSSSTMNMAGMLMDKGIDFTKIVG